MRLGILLSLALILLLPVTVHSAEYLIRIEFIESTYDEETSVDELLETLTVMSVEATVRPGQPFEVTKIDGERKLTMKGTVTTVQGTELGVRDFTMEQENRGSSSSSSGSFNLTALREVASGYQSQPTANGERQTVMYKYLAMGWKLPIDEAALAKKEQAIQDIRLTLMRTHMLNLRQAEFTKQKAATTLLELARQQLAEGDFRVGLLLIDSFDFKGTDVEQEAAEVRKSLALQIKHVDLWKVPLP